MVVVDVLAEDEGGLGVVGAVEEDGVGVGGLGD